MNEVKNKLNMERNVVDPQFNSQLQVFLHDYYENYDGGEEIQQMEYGMQEVILRNITDQVKQNAKGQGAGLGYEFFRGRNALQKMQYISKHRQTAQQKRKARFNLKGITQLEDKQVQAHVQMKKKLQTLDDQIDELFEPFHFFINSKQAKVIIKEWNENRITSP